MTESEDTKPKLFLQGTRVSVAGFSGTFEVVNEQPNRKSEYELARGDLRFFAHVSRITLTPGANPKSKRKRDSRAEAKGLVKAETAESTAFAPRFLKLDLHGLTAEQANLRLRDTLNEALLAEMDGIEVIHGIGRGRLADVVEAFGEKASQVKKVARNPRNQGITMFYF